MKTDRLVGIIMLLLEKKRVRAQEIADMYEVSLRTVYRDLDAIGRAGIPVTAVSGVNGGFEIMPQYKLNSSCFTAQELSALLIGLSGMNGIIPAQQLTGTIAKISGIVPDNRRDEIEKNTGQYFFDRTPWSGGEYVRGVFETVQRAMEEKHLLAFDYVSTKAKLTSRLVRPCRAVLKGNNYYLYAYCTEKQDYRLFRMSRMINCAITEETYIPQSFPEPVLDYENGILAMQTEIRLLADESIFDRILEFCPYDKITRTPQGLLVNYPFIENDYYYDILLSFGDKCECLSPEHVREEIKRRILSMAEKYNLSVK